MTDAITREEKLMKAIATGNPSNIKPITREEMFLAKAGGQDVQTPEPITRREKLLQGIIDNGGGGGSTGGGGDIDALIDGSIEEVVSNVESIGGYAFYGKVKLEEIDFPNAKSIGKYAFGSPYSERLRITQAYFPSVTTVDVRAFDSCDRLIKAEFPLATSFGMYTFNACKALNFINLGFTAQIPTNLFYSCQALTTLVLRNETVCTLSNINAFTSTPFASGGTGGVAYVPQNLIADYEIATNWSSLNVTFLPIEGSEYE